VSLEKSGQGAAGTLDGFLDHGVAPIYFNSDDEVSCEVPVALIVSSSNRLVEVVRAARPRRLQPRGGLLLPRLPSAPPHGETLRGQPPAVNHAPRAVSRFSRVVEPARGSDMMAPGFYPGVQRGYAGRGSARARPQAGAARRASNAARCTARHGVRSHADAVELVAECSIPVT
jgi:hypothetical protein